VGPRQQSDIIVLCRNSTVQIESYPDGAVRDATESLRWKVGSTQTLNFVERTENSIIQIGN
jgi:hypothetical protein